MITKHRLLAAVALCATSAMALAGRAYDNPTPSDVHVNVPLTNISVAMMQDATNFIADRVFPNIPVAKQSDRYYTYDRGYFNRDEMKIRAPSTESAGSGYTLDNTPNYFCPVYAFHHDIDDQRRGNSDAMLDPDREAVALVTNKGLLKRETNWVGQFFVGGVWTADMDGVSTGENNTTTFRQWNDANSTPIENVRAAKTAVLQLTGVEPNTLIMGQQVFDALIDHPDIVDRVKYGQSGVGKPADIDVAELVALFKIPRIFIMKSIQNTAREGAANAHSFIGGKKALMCYAAPSPGLMTPSAGYTFSWTGYLGAAAQGQRITRMRADLLKSDRVEIEMAFDQKLIAADLGFFWDTIVA